MGTGTGTDVCGSRREPNFLQQEFFRNFSNKRSNRARSDILDDADHGNRAYLLVQENYTKFKKNC